MIWLGNKRGNLTDWVTQRWVCLTGKRLKLEDNSWIDGPIGGTRLIADECFKTIAERDKLEIINDSSVRGIVADFSTLDSPEFPIHRISLPVREFYEKTSSYEMDAWSEWCGVLRPLGWLVARLFSQRLQQLNVPLSGLDTSRGLTNEVWHLQSPQSKQVKHVAWIRRRADTRGIVYSGAYTDCYLPGTGLHCLKVVFPLPNGNALVIMRPVVHDDGSASFVSSGKTFGDLGFYFAVHHGDGTASVRYVSTMRESIHVFATETGETRANHVMRIWGIVFLRLHYRLRKIIT